MLLSTMMQRNNTVEILAQLEMPRLLRILNNTRNQETKNVNIRKR